MYHFKSSTLEATENGLYKTGSKKIWNEWELGQMKICMIEYDFAVLNESKT